MNIETAKTLKTGQIVYHTEKKNKDGSAMRAKVTSIKTWKRNQSRIEIGLKHGLYDYAKFDQDEIQYLSLKE
jgi:hypothetical protein